MGACIGSSTVHCASTCPECIPTEGPLYIYTVPTRRLRFVQGILVRRPSASVKTPYVADVRLECTAPAAAADGTEGGGTGGGGELVLAHAPAMDCAGMVMPGCRLYMSRNVRKEGAPPTATSHAIQVRACYHAV